MKKIVTLLLGMFITQINVSADENRMNEQKSSPLGFEENKGQIIDQHGAARPDVQFRLVTPGMVVFIGDGQLHYQFYKLEDNGVQLKNIPTILSGQKFTLPPAIHTYRMDVKLEGANTRAEVITENITDGYANYYTGHCGNNGGLKVQSYKKITYKDIYPGIDWVLYLKDNVLEYDFVVHPKGSMDNIIISYSGADRIQLLEDGSLKAKTIYGSITEQAPYAYQQHDNKKIASRFQLRDNTLTFVTAPFTGTLVIDPTVQWATYFGGDAHNSATSVAASASGHAYMVGTTSSAANVATIGSHKQTLPGGNADAWLAKFDNLGNRIWATYYGGTTSYSEVFPMLAGYDAATSVAIDDKHHLVYMAGKTNSTDNIATPNSFQDTLSFANYGQMQGFSLGTDAFLVQFDTSGERQWATYLGDDSSDMSFFYSDISIAHDSRNDKINIALGACKTGLATNGTHQSRFRGDYDALIVQFDKNGSRQWATYYGGDSIDVAFGITVDHEGDIYVAGMTSSPSEIATPNTHQPLISADGLMSGIAFLAKLRSDGTRVWGTYYGDEAEIGHDVACDKFGHVYMTGYTITNQLTNNPVIATPGAWQTTNGGINGFSPSDKDAFLAQFNMEDGKRNWGTFYGGESYEYGHEVECDTAGYVYMVGYTSTRSAAFPDRLASENTYQDTLAGEQEFHLTVSPDAFIAQFDTAGRRMWASYYGGIGTDANTLKSVSLACSYDNSLYMVGATDSRSGIATPGSYQDTLIHGAATLPFLQEAKNAYLVKFVPVDITVDSDLDTLCAGDHDLEAILRNNGVVAQDTINVTYVYTNNRTANTDTLTAATVQPLAAGTSVSVPFGTHMLDTGSYTLAIYIKHVRHDAVKSNDTLLRQVYVKDCSVTSINAVFENNIDIYPNPAKETLYISMPDNMPILKLTIFDILGTLIYTEALDTSTNSRSLNVTNLIPGNYMLRIATENGYINKPFQIQTK